MDSQEEEEEAVQMEEEAEEEAEAEVEGGGCTGAGFAYTKDSMSLWDGRIECKQFGNWISLVTWPMGVLSIVRDCWRACLRHVASAHAKTVSKAADD